MRAFHFQMESYKHCETETRSAKQKASPSASFTKAVQENKKKKRLAKTWLCPQKKHNPGDIFGSFLSDPRSWDPHTLTLDTIDGS